MNELYFDNNATTPLDEAVLEAVQTALAETYANPASPHPLGEQALAAVDRARASVARLLGVTSKEIVFTSGGTESIHTALHIALAERPPGHVVTSAVEHPAVLRPLEFWTVDLMCSSSAKAARAPVWAIALALNGWRARFSNPAMCAGAKP